MRKIVILLFIGLIPGVLAAQPIKNEWQANSSHVNISYQNYLVNRVLDLHNPDGATSNVPVKSGTFVLHELLNEWDNLSSEQQQLLKPVLSRPNLANSVISPSGNFKIHYTTSGINRVSSVDNDLNGVPDYVDSVAYYFDYARHIEIDELGYKPPPMDKVDGLEYDVYIVNFDLYGETAPEEQVNSSPRQYSSYINIENDYKGNFPTSGIAGMKVTTAHEFFHAIHMGYKYERGLASFDKYEVFFYEISSTWMEDFVYDDINDYYFYLDTFFNNPNTPFTSFSGLYPYGNCLWAHMLVKKYEPNIIKEIWEEIDNRPVMDAIALALNNHGSSFGQEFTDYAAWNYFTGSRANPAAYYEEGAYYPEMRLSQSYSFDADTTIEESCRELAFSYYSFNVPSTGETITLIPVNFEQQTSEDRSVTFQISGHNGHLYNPVTQGFYVRMIVDEYQDWQANAIVLDNNSQASVMQFPAIEEGTINGGTKLLGYGPNPYRPDQDDKFSVFFQLDEPSRGHVVILDENGRQIDFFDLPKMAAGPNSFSWNPRKYGEFPGGSGIYLLYLETDGINELIKFAVIR
ncbi:hypothetical protein JW960_16805 [candidate division KSB1 bacterium]|nr:hypothetical protein [candidate division KSB1 bacterium]